MITTADRNAELELIARNIERSGFHSYTVTGGGVPHWAYTIGLSRSIGSELVLAGAYFYALQDLPQIIQRVVDKAKSDVDLDVLRIDLGSLGVFSLRPVETGWTKDLMSGALNFFQVDGIPALQIVPDERHWTIEIPDLSTPRSAITAPSWQWLDKSWDYPIPPRAIGITNLDALRGGRITEVMRWEEDEWELFVGSGPDVAEEDRRVIPLGILLGADSSLPAIVNLTVGTGLWRDDVSDWHLWGSRHS